MTSKIKNFSLIPASSYYLPKIPITAVRRLTMINYDRVNFVTSILLILSVLLKEVN